MTDAYQTVLFISYSQFFRHQNSGECPYMVTWFKYGDCKCKCTEWVITTNIFKTQAWVGALPPWFPTDCAPINYTSAPSHAPIEKWTKQRILFRFKFRTTDASSTRAVLLHDHRHAWHDGEFRMDDGHTPGSNCLPAPPPASTTAGDATASKATDKSLFSAGMQKEWELALVMAWSGAAEWELCTSYSVTNFGRMGACSSYGVTNFGRMGACPSHGITNYGRLEEGQMSCRCLERSMKYDMTVTGLSLAALLCGIPFKRNKQYQTHLQWIPWRCQRSTSTPDSNQGAVVVFMY